MWQGTTDDGCVALAELLGWKVTALVAITSHAILLVTLMLLRSDLFFFFEIENEQIIFPYVSVPNRSWLRCLTLQGIHRNASYTSHPNKLTGVLESELRI